MKDITNPEYYKDGGIQAIELMQLKLPKEQFIGFLRCNILKYILRYDSKGGVGDLKKALWYINNLINVLEGKKLELG